MITIAGAKGGCGKTTTTLGLAKAFAEAGTPTIAVDADRQLPDLHTTAEVSREPTLAALDGDDDVTSIAKQVPGAPGVGVIPAQRSSETVDFKATLGQLDYDTVEVLVDSPSGAGPDVVEPLTVADQIVVVTTGTERSVEAAETTIDVAERLDVPVAGVVFTRCDRVPDALAERFDVSILGSVPEREEPLANEDVVEAYDAIASTLARETADIGHEDAATQRTDRMPTGVNGLDRLLEGGVRPGSLVTLAADPASQSELLLQDLTGTRGTLYLTTERSEAVVRDALESTPVEVGSPTVRHLDAEEPLAQALEFVEDLPDGANVVIDHVGALEAADRAAYVEFLNSLKERVLETDGLAVLHALESDVEPANRSRTEHVSDAVVRFETEVRDGRVVNKVDLQKFRAEARPNQSEVVEFREAVPVDTPAK